MQYTPATVTLSLHSFTEAAQRVAAYKALYPGTEPTVFVRGTFRDERGEIVFAGMGWSLLEEIGRKWARIDFYNESIRVKQYGWDEIGLEPFDIQIRG